MLKIRLTRIGKRHEPHYRIIVIPARTKRDGKAIDLLGHYNPKTKELKLDVEKAKHWLSVGAQPTVTVHAMLAKHKLVEQLPRPKRDPKKPKKEQKAESKEAPAVSPKKEEPKEDKKTEVKEEKTEVKEEKQKEEEKKESKEEKNPVKEEGKK